MTLFSARENVQTPILFFHRAAEFRILASLYFSVLGTLRFWEPAFFPAFCLHGKNRIFRCDRSKSIQMQLEK